MPATAGDSVDDVTGGHLEKFEVPVRDMDAPQFQALKRLAVTRSRSRHVASRLEKSQGWDFLRSTGGGR
jgi:hypothetical protein